MRREEEGCLFCCFACASFDHKRKIAAVHYRIPHFYSSRTKQNLEKRTSDVHSSPYQDLGKLFPESQTCSTVENGWLTLSVTHASTEEEEELEFHSGQARVDKSADCSRQCKTVCNYPIDLLR